MSDNVVLDYSSIISDSLFECERQYDVDGFGFGELLEIDQVQEIYDDIEIEQKIELFEQVVKSNGHKPSDYFEGDQFQEYVESKFRVRSKDPDVSGEAKEKINTMISETDVVHDTIYAFLHNQNTPAYMNFG